MSRKTLVDIQQLIELDILFLSQEAEIERLQASKRPAVEIMADVDSLNKAITAQAQALEQLRAKVVRG